MSRPFAAAQSSTFLIALLRRSMPSGRFNELSSMSRSIRVMSYVVMTFSNWAAIESTFVQLSASSVPWLSAAYPPNDGITSPPRERIALMSLPNDDAAIGRPVSPFQYAVHDPALGVWTKAMVRNRLPDCCDNPFRLSPLYASKYGANTCAGMRETVAASAWGDRVRKPPAPTAAAAAAARVARRDRRMRPLRGCG